VSVVNLPAGAVAWLANGERGVSSEAIFSHLTGLQISRLWSSPPWDPDDLRRCRLLLQAIPALRADLPRMAELGPEWAAIVGAWDELCALMDAESPDWSDGRGGAPRTSARMQALLDGAGRGAR
jgi:hypothetical protein